MAARRGKSQARRNNGGSNSMPGWAWLVIGVLLAVVVFLAAPQLLKGGGTDGFFRPKPNPDAQPAPVVDAGGEPVVSDKPAAKPAAATGKPAQDYDFYELLPGQEVAMTDAQIAAAAREEAARKARDAAAASKAPQPIDATPAPTPTPPPATAATPTTPAPAPVAPTPPATATTPPAPKPSVAPTTAATAAPAVSTPKPVATAAPAAKAAPYILQAGAFQASGDAEALKARIALLGLNARVESASINGKTMYRVRLGPYGSAADLSEAKSKLGSSGVSAVAIKAN